MWGVLSKVYDFFRQFKFKIYENITLMAFVVDRYTIWTCECPMQNKKNSESILLLLKSRGQKSKVNLSLGTGVFNHLAMNVHPTRTV